MTLTTILLFGIFIYDVIRREKAKVCQAYSCPDSNSKCVQLPDSTTYADLTVYSIMNCFRCECHVGYYWSNGACIDVDECYENIHDCTGSPTITTVPTYYGNCNSENSQCSNLVGSYSCSCQSGFMDKYGDMSLCMDYDECSQPVCRANSSCLNLPGSYQCPCFDGYEYKGKVTTIIRDLCTQVIAVWI